MALNIKKLQTPSHPPVTSVTLSIKVRRLTTEESSKGDYTKKSLNPKMDDKKETPIKEEITPIKKLDLI